MAKYMALIFGPESVWQDSDEETLQAMYAEYTRFGEEYGQYLRGSAELKPNATAKLIKKTGDDAYAVTDGAFGETKEALGGYYVIEADDEVTAIEIAKHVPAIGGFIELRPIADE
ncbi:YciI family protein [Gryllotalpicola reticulitermitis]|uniref:YciI family protein n=1 Tax=Gryllotalpicola reticulitermitis TaxID=1184153 RepID=A0ABV8Q7U3_9MICO